MNHTPGPWLFCDDSGPDRNIWADTTIVATTEGHWVDCETADYNAYLIAAAPELLQALERAVALIAWELTHDVTDKWPNVSGVKQEIEKASRAIISKATGRQA